VGEVSRQRPPTVASPRPRVLVIADDLTGANAAGAAFARARLRAATVVGPRSAGSVGDGFDVLVVNTESRHADASTAATRVGDAVGAQWPVDLVSKRIDTTMRGNISVEVAAALEAVRRRRRERVVALCLPAHPAAGRVTVGGRQLLDGRPLEETEVSRDRRGSPPTSRIAEVLAPTGDLRVAEIPLSAVRGDRATLVAQVGSALAAGADVLVGDATTEQDLDRLATAAIAAGGSGAVHWVGVDPGPGSVALARALGIAPRASLTPLLAVSGSATERTQAQLARLRERQPVRVVRLPLEPRGTSVRDAARTLTEALEEADAGDVVLLATALAPADVRPVAAEEVAPLLEALAEVVRLALDRVEVGGLFLTGGDVTGSVLDRLEADALELVDEVLPLAVYGAVVGGPWVGLPLVTKGGLVGGDDAIVDCLAHLRDVAPRPSALPPHSRSSSHEKELT
jgi:uncharacterized protein YgbK (DUF1537 family)